MLVHSIILASLCVVLNLIGGGLRVPYRRQSFWWLFWIHIPIPFVAAYRMLFGFSYRIIPMLLVLAIFGQLMGGRLRKRWDGRRVDGCEAG